MYQMDVVTPVDSEKGLKSRTVGEILIQSLLSELQQTRLTPKSEIQMRNQIHYQRRKYKSTQNEIEKKWQGDMLNS